MDWWNLMKQSVTVGAQLLWSGRYGCNNGRYGCTIVMSHIEINKAVSQWLLTFNLCVSVTWPLTCAFHIPCTHTPEIIDMHRGMCGKRLEQLGSYNKASNIKQKSYKWCVSCVNIFVIFNIVYFLMRLFVIERKYGRVRLSSASSIFVSNVV